MVLPSTPKLTMDCTLSRPGVSLLVAPTPVLISVTAVFSWPLRVEAFLNFGGLWPSGPAVHTAGPYPSYANLLPAYIYVVKVRSNLRNEFSSLFDHIGTIRNFEALVGNLKTSRSFELSSNSVQHYQQCLHTCGCLSLENAIRFPAFLRCVLPLGRII